MKKLLLFSLVTLSFLVTMNGCEKEPIPTPNPINYDLLLDEQPVALVGELEATLTLPEVTDMNVGDALITDYPAFLDYDPFTVVIARTNSADSCLKGLEVTKAQKEQLTKSFLSKIECQKVNKATIARIHRDIEYWAKVQKENYYKNWYMVEKNKLNDSLKLGLLTESQYKEKLSMLEKTWKAKVENLVILFWTKLLSAARAPFSMLCFCSRKFVKVVVILKTPSSYQEACWLPTCNLLNAASRISTFTFNNAAPCWTLFWLQRIRCQFQSWQLFLK